MQISMNPATFAVMRRWLDGERPTPMRPVNRATIGQARAAVRFMRDNRAVRHAAVVNFDTSSLTLLECNLASAFMAQPRALDHGQILTRTNGRKALVIRFGGAR